MLFVEGAVFKTLIPPTPADRIEAADFELNETSGSVSSSLAELPSSSLDYKTFYVFYYNKKLRGNQQKKVIDLVKNR